LKEIAGAPGTIRTSAPRFVVKGSKFKTDERPAAAFVSNADSIADGPHQFRTRNDLNKTQRTRSITDKNAGKSTIATVILPLITGWLQVRGLANQRRNQQLISIAFAVVRSLPQLPKVGCKIDRVTIASTTATGNVSVTSPFIRFGIQLYDAPLTTILCRRR
jgi:hypothetical protein